MIAAVAGVSPELRQCLAALLGPPEGRWRLATSEPLKQEVHRLRFAAAGRGRSFVIKRSTVQVARRTQFVATRWLPAVGLDDHGPGLLALVPDRAADRIWHVYEDLGPRVLDAEAPVREHVEATVGVMARLHTTFAGHPLVPECRAVGGDLGMAFYVASVRNGIAALQALAPGDPGGQRTAAVRDRLLARLRRLEDETAERAAGLRALRVPRTLLHGDLWAVNVMLAGRRVRLIDWDHAGVGPISYDLSTFLLRFAAGERRWILDAYRRETERLAGWELPADAELDRLFETAELARYSSVVRGGATAVRSPHAEWAIEELESIDGWFAAFEPVLGSAP